MIDITLACKDAISKLVEVITVDVDAEKCVDDSLGRIWKLKTMSARFGQVFEVEAQARF